jgi:hypothetical protein
VQNRFFLEVRGMGGRGRGWRAAGSDNPNNVCIYEYMNKEKKLMRQILSSSFYR